MLNPPQYNAGRGSPKALRPHPIENLLPSPVDGTCYQANAQRLSFTSHAETPPIAHLRSTTESPAVVAASRDSAAARTLARIGQYPEFDLAPLETRGLQPRDAALARAIDHTVARHWITLETLIRSRINRPWDRVQKETRAALLVGAAQLFYMDGIPDHAAADCAVEWTKHRVNAKAGGFVNAIMRSLIRLRGERSEVSGQMSEVRAARSDALHAGHLSQRELPLPSGQILSLSEPIFAEDPAARLAQQTSHPEPLIARWNTIHGEEQARNLALHSLVHPPIIMTGATESEQTRAHSIKGYSIFEGERAALTTLLKSEPHARVQDPTSAAAVELAKGLPALRIADICAGYGTKTGQLAALFPDATIFAGDPDTRRLAALHEAFDGHPRVTIIEPGGWVEHAGAFDLVLADVPCSNTGVLARRVEAKYRFSQRSTDSLIDLQREILIDALRLRTEKGSILYSTCSIDPQENDEQMQWIETHHPLRRSREQTALPSGVPGGDPAHYHDGGYAALLEPRP